MASLSAQAYRVSLLGIVAVMSATGCSLVTSLDDLGAGAASGTGAASTSTSPGGSGGASSASGGDGGSGAAEGGTGGSGAGGSSGGHEIWSRRFGDASDGQVAFGTAVDADGAITIAGYSEGPIDFGGGVLLPGGAFDVVVARLDPDGNYVWAKRFGDAGTQYALDVAAAPNGHAVVVGAFSGELDFGGGPLIAEDGLDAFAVELDSAGGHVWSQRFGGDSLQGALAVTVDSGGSAIVAGYLQGTMTAGSFTLTSAGLDDVFATRLDKDGVPVWAKQFGDAAHQSPWGIAADASGAVVVAGEFEGTIGFGGAALTSAGGTDAFLAKLDVDGDHVWSKRYGNGNRQSAGGVAVAPGGEVLVAGSFEGSIDLGGGQLVTAGGFDAFVAKLTANGAHIWSDRYGDELDQGAVVRTDAQGNALLAGGFEGVIDLGGGPLTSGGGVDVFAAKLGLGGDHLWSIQAGAAEPQVPYGFGVSPDGAPVIGGEFMGSLDFGSGPLTSSGGSDIFVVKLSP